MGANLVGISVQLVFELIFQLALFGKNQYRFLESKHGQGLPKKDVYYNFLNNSKYAWSRFLFMLASKVTEKFDQPPPTSYWIYVSS
jgi:hypothetical protein